MSNLIYSKVKETKPLKMKTNPRKTFKMKGLRNNLGKILMHEVSYLLDVEVCYNQSKVATAKHYIQRISQKGLIDSHQI